MVPGIGIVNELRSASWRLIAWTEIGQVQLGKRRGGKGGYFYSHTICLSPTKSYPVVAKTSAKSDRLLIAY